MADKTVVHMGENSPEKVAYDLLKDVAAVEKKLLYTPSGSLTEGYSIASRKWILDTYAECLQAITAPYARE